MISRFFPIAGLLFTSVLLISDASFALSTLAPGPFAVASGEYKLPAAVDNDVLENTPTELWARAFWPKDLSSARPIVFLLHGNHPTCATLSNTREEAGCQYTHTGTCKDDQTVIPNHEGHSYLASHLATHGYIAVTINANRGITCGAGKSGDMGLILARGRLILKHIELWRSWSTSGGASAELAVPSDAFVGAVDLSNIGLFGHSRGGEGARAAYNLFHDPDSVWALRLPGIDIKGIFEIGAVDGQSARVLDADNTAWNQLLPMCDGDVDDLQGRMPFERMLSKNSELRKKPKSLYMVWGANHNFFNTEWHNSDSQGCVGHDPIFDTSAEEIVESKAQQKVAISAVTAFFLANVNRNKNPWLSAVFDPLHPFPQDISSITRVDRDYYETHDSLFNTKLEEFNRPTGVNTYGPSNEASGIEISHDQSDSPARASVRWTKTGAETFLQLNWSENAQGVVFDSDQILNFRIGRQSEHEGSMMATDFTIQFVDENGSLLNPVSLSDFADVLGPVNYTTLFQTVRVPLSKFQIPPGTKLKGLRFTFDKNSPGYISLANVRMTKPLNFLPSAQNKKRLQTEVKLSRHSLAPRQARVYRAELLSIISKTDDKSPNLFTENDTIEIAVKSDKAFPVGARLPRLVIDQKAYWLSRMPDDGSLNTLIFSVKRSEASLIQKNSRIRVEYGQGNTRQVWIVR